MLKFSKLFFLFLNLILLSPMQTAYSESHLCEGFVEENDLRIPVRDANFQKVTTGVSEADFHEVVDRAARVYSPYFSKVGKRLQVKKKWDDAQVNAVAYIEGSNSVIEIWGGLARHSTITPDGLALVVCHEIGHHLGGAPKITSRSDGKWASVEGQSDYFATMKCLRRVFMDDLSSWNGDVDPEASTICEAAYGQDEVGVRLCERIAMASMSSGRLSAALGQVQNPRFDSDDTSVVNQTSERHPAAQCRLDTYMNGNICEVSEDVDFDDRNPDTGACRHIEAEEYGARPRCWFKPSTSTAPGPGPTPPPSPQPPPQPNPPPTPGPTPQPPPNPPPQPPNPGPGPVPPPAPSPNPGPNTTTPLLNGQLVLDVQNPNQVLRLTWDVSQIPGASGIYFEILGPDLEFQNPNGVRPDSRARPGGSIAQTRGSIGILPARQLQGWGQYKIRVIALDRSGRQAVRQFSDPVILNLRP